MAKSFINALLSVIITYSIIIAIKLLAKMAKSLPGPKTGIQMPYSTFAVVNSAKILSVLFAQFWPHLDSGQFSVEQFGNTSKLLIKKLQTNIQQNITIKQQDWTSY